MYGARIGGAMNRSRYFNYIEENLNTLSVRIDQRGKQNILDLHLHSENFFQHFMNILFDWNLENMNAIKQNAEAIDLIDKNNKIIAQVSATATKKKVESALSKDISIYSGHTFKFISISKAAGNLRKQSYKYPNKLPFDPQTDIYDMAGLLAKVKNLDIERQKALFELVKKEFGREPDVKRIDSNLARIINIMAQEDWDSEVGNYQVIDFEIDHKIEYNNLSGGRIIIEEYALFSSRIKKIYNEFSRAANNKSNSVLASMKKIYAANKAAKSDDALFFHIIDQVMERVQSSRNYNPIPFEELEQCAGILVVDAFMKCKVFKNPKGEANAAT